MDFRCPRFFLILAVAALLILSGCVGKSTPNPTSGGVQTVTLSPASTLSLEFGRTQNFSAQAHNSAGGTVFTTINFVSDNNAVLTISNSGVACAGKWDSLINPVRCSPGVEGIANVTAEAEGVSSAPASSPEANHTSRMLTPRRAAAAPRARRDRATTPPGWRCATARRVCRPACTGA